MAVAFDASSESHAATGSASEASFGWTHTPAGTPAGALVFVFTHANADNISSVTYGGTTMTEVVGGEAIDTANEPGRCTTFFLGSSVPTGNQTVTVNRTNNATVMYAVAATVTAASDTAVTGIVLLQNNQALAEQSVTDGSPGSNSVRFAGVASGLGTAPGPGAASTALQDIVIGARSNAVVRETTAGQGARNVGFTAGTSDDVAAVHLAVREVTNATISATAVATVSAVNLPTLSTGSTLTATAVATASTVDLPTLSTGSTVIATAVDSVSTIGVPVLVVAEETDTVATSSTIDPPTLSTGSTITATDVATASTVDLPTLSTGSTLTTTTVVTSAAVDAPTISAGLTVTSTAVDTVSVVDLPTLSTGSTVTAIDVATASTIDLPILSTGSTVTSAVVATSAAVDAPTLSTGSTAATITVATSSAIGVPTVLVGAVPVSISNLHASGTGVNAASYTTASMNFVGGRHYIASVIWASAGAEGCALPIALSTTSGMSFVAAVCPGSDGSNYSRTPGSRRMDLFIGYCSGNTSGTLTFTPDATQHPSGFGDIEVIVDEVQNAHVGVAATDCLVQAVRVDTTGNGTSQTMKLAAFADPDNNAGYAVVQNAVDEVHTWTGPTELADLGGTASPFFALSSAWKAGQHYSYASSWSSSSSHHGQAMEIRAAGSVAPIALTATKAVAFSGNDSTTTNTLTVPFVSGRPVIIIVNAERVDDPQSAQSVVSASNTFSKITGAVINYETIASPDRRLEAWICTNPVGGSEVVTITMPKAMARIDAFAVELPGGSGTIVQTAADVEDSGGTNQTLSATLSALSASDNMVLVFFVADGTVGSATQLLPGDGLRYIALPGYIDGNNYTSHFNNTIQLGALLGRSATPQVELKNGTARNIAGLFLEVHAIGPVAVSTIATASVVGTPTVAAGSSVVAVAVDTVSTIGVPTLSVESTQTTTTILTSSTVGVPTVSAGSTQMASEVITSVGMDAPGVSTGGSVDATVMPVALVTTSGVDVPSVAGVVDVLATTASTVSAIGTPVVSASASLEAITLTTSSSIDPAAAEISSSVIFMTLGTASSIGSPVIRNWGFIRGRLSITVRERRLTTVIREVVEVA